MLAGRMKLTNFLALVGVGGAGLIGGGLYFTGFFEDRPEPVDKPEVTSPAISTAAEVPVAQPSSGPPPADPAALAGLPPAADAVETVPDEAPPAATDPSRPWDAFLLERAGSALGSKKLKDAAKGKSWKVNLYQDDGESTMNRAKVDIDRDDKWDEKWTFKADSVTRKVAPADDEDYTEVFAWDGGTWVAE